MTSTDKWPANSTARRSVESLIPYARNARTHAAEQVAQIAASITEWGWTTPVLIDGDDGIIAGHGRILAAQLLGIADVPVIVASGWTEAQKRAYIIADNQLTINGAWDEDLLRVELEDLRSSDFEIDLLGFDSSELNDILKNEEEYIDDNFTEPEIDIAEQLRGKWGVKTGQKWELGKHRLLCGDATNSQDVENLMGGEIADLCLTDPPYGLGDGKDSGKNKYKSYSDTRANLKRIAPLWLDLAIQTAKVTVFSPGVTNAWLYPEPKWMMCWFYGGGPLLSSWGFNCWQPFLCYGKDPSLASGNGGRPDAVDMNTPANAADIDHPCPKPMKLWKWFIERLSFGDKDVLYEPFCGSGTTIIACEMLGRVCRAIEIDPAYVAVSLQRFEDETGKTPILVSDPNGSNR